MGVVRTRKRKQGEIKMKKMITLLLAVVLAACATNTKVNVPTSLNDPQAKVVIAVVRPLLRTALTAYLSTRGVPPAVSATAFTVIDPVIDELLTTGNINSILANDGAWTAAKSAAIDKLAKAATTIKVNNAPIFDADSAKALSSMTLDLVESLIRANAGVAGK
jgi:hypothetical protein